MEVLESVWYLFVKNQISLFVVKFSQSFLRRGHWSKSVDVSSVCTNGGFYYLMHNSQKSVPDSTRRRLEGNGTDTWHGWSGWKPMLRPCKTKPKWSLIERFWQITQNKHQVFLSEIEIRNLAKRSTQKVRVQEEGVTPGFCPSSIGCITSVGGQSRQSRKALAKQRRSFSLSRPLLRPKTVGQLSSTLADPSRKTSIFLNIQAGWLWIHKNPKQSNATCGLKTSIQKCRQIANQWMPLVAQVGTNLMPPVTVLERTNDFLPTKQSTWEGKGGQGIRSLQALSSNHFKTFHASDLSEYFHSYLVQLCNINSASRCANVLAPDSQEHRLDPQSGPRPRPPMLRVAFWIQTGPNSRIGCLQTSLWANRLWAPEKEKRAWQKETACVSAPRKPCTPSPRRTHTNTKAMCVVSFQFISASFWGSEETKQTWLFHKSTKSSLRRPWRNMDWYSP